MDDTEAFCGACGVRACVRAHLLASVKQTPHLIKINTFIAIPIDSIRPYFTNLDPRRGSETVGTRSIELFITGNITQIR